MASTIQRRVEKVEHQLAARRQDPSEFAKSLVLLSDEGLYDVVCQAFSQDLREALAAADSGDTFPRVVDLLARIDSDSSNKVAYLHVVLDLVKPHYTMPSLASVEKWLRDTRNAPAWARCAPISFQLKHRRPEGTNG